MLCTGMYNYVWEVLFRLITGYTERIQKYSLINIFLPQRKLVKLRVLSVAQKDDRNEARASEIFLHKITTRSTILL